MSINALISFNFTSLALIRTSLFTCHAHINIYKYCFMLKYSKNFRTFTFKKLVTNKNSAIKEKINKSLIN